jgi:sodium-coupled neutral amino acid transporter 11
MGFYPARDAIQRTLGFESDERQPTSIQHYCVTFVLFVLLLVVGIHVDSLGKVYSFVGGVASSFLAYIIPGIIYITVFHPEWIPKMRSSSRSRESEPLIESTDLKVRIVSTWWLDIASVVLIVFGIMIVTLTIVRAF